MVLPFRSIRKILAEIDQRLLECLHDSDPAILQSIAPFVTNQGKRVRPALVYLSTLAVNSEIAEVCHKYALVTELIHIASLFHDDVLDNAGTRRGRPTAHRVLGKDTAVLAGDILYLKALTMMESETIFRRRVVNQTVSAMIHAEILQEIKRYSLITEEEYFSIISGKTGGLIGLSCFLGGSLSENSEWMDALIQYGQKLGITFQMIDDLLDWTGGPTLGKDLHSDAREGRITLPVIRLLEKMDSREKSLFVDELTNPQKPLTPDVAEKYTLLMKNTGVEESVRLEAISMLHDAAELLVQLPDTPFRHDLKKLSEGLINRAY